jgi:CBS domain-containing protein
MRARWSWGRTSRETPVADLMIKAVVCVKPSDTIQGCMALMTQKRVRHLPVLEGERLVGIVTIGDVVKRMITEQAMTIEQLESYIRGSY